VRAPFIFLIIFSPFAVVIKNKQEIRNPAVGELQRVVKAVKAKTFRPSKIHMGIVAVYDDGTMQ
jgi:hypothetical protein